jgi:hypothetical protein
MVVHELDIAWTVGRPDETDPEFLIESDAILPAPIPFERLEVVARRQKQSTQGDHSRQLIELPARDMPELARAHLPCSTRINAVKHVLGPGICERLNHAGDGRTTTS